MPSVGAVAIGRNEGTRLHACLRSLVGKVDQVVYVDSGSTDGSVQFAQDLGVFVVDLDMRRPFTMARGRNAGFAALAQLLPGLSFVQFVDGDCEVQQTWIEASLAALRSDPKLGSVCGHRTERYPEGSIYNRLADMDWRGSVGEVAFCGGDVMMLAEAFRQAGGYREQMIAGEDPEICVRLRQNGWTLRRLDIPMTLHDAAMTHFSQWWKRTIRTGYGYAHGARMHRDLDERPWRREVQRNFFWGLILPLAILTTVIPTSGASLVFCLLYPVWMWRISKGRRKLFGDTAKDAWVYAFFCMVGKLPTSLGQLLFHWRTWTRQTPQLIEYKTNAKAN